MVKGKKTRPNVVEYRNNFYVSSSCKHPIHLKFSYNCGTPFYVPVCSMGVSCRCLEFKSKNKKRLKEFLKEHQYFMYHGIQIKRNVLKHKGKYYVSSDDKMPYIRLERPYGYIKYFPTFSSSLNK